MKPLKCSKAETYKEVLLKAIEKFKITEKISNVRIRKYENASKVMLTTYENENQRLEDMKLPSFPRMIIEIKKDDEVFEKFDKNTIILRLVFWKEGLKSIKTTDLDY